MIIKNHLIKEFEGKEFLETLNLVKNSKKIREQLRNKNLELTSKKIRESFTKEVNIMLAIQTYDSLVINMNSITKKFIEWYSYYFPEIIKEFDNDYEKIIASIDNKPKFELRKKYLKKYKNLDVGGEIDNDDFEILYSYLDETRKLREFKDKLSNYIKDSMKKEFPNLESVAGGLIGAKLLEHVHGIKNLVLSPSSKIQLLGAEKALFRHLKTGAKSPKYGLLFSHPLVQSAPSKFRGKMARLLADKISLAAKMDYFKGEFIGDKLNEELKLKLNSFIESKKEETQK